MTVIACAKHRKRKKLQPGAKAKLPILIELCRIVIYVTGCHSIDSCLN